MAAGLSFCLRSRPADAPLTGCHCNPLKPCRSLPPALQAQGAPRVPRTTSVNSYKNYQALPAEQQAQLAEALQVGGWVGG